MMVGVSRIIKTGWLSSALNNLSVRENVVN